MQITSLSLLRVMPVLVAGVLVVSNATPEQPRPGGRFGGRVVVAQRVEPRTLNPFAALDTASREAIGLLHADLIHIGRTTLEPEPSIAAKWSVSKDGRIYTMQLRRNVRFSDGHPLTADDVLFTLRAHLDEKVNSPQRETLFFGGKPIEVRKLDDHTVEVSLAAPSASAERVFDSLAVLPEHLLGPFYRNGSLGKAWPLTVTPNAVAGLGPFRLKQHIAGERLIFERNPHYWKSDQSSRPLPYVDEIVFELLGSEDRQRLHFQAGQSHLLPAVNPQHFRALRAAAASSGHRMLDLGPGLEYSFLVFNQNALTPGANEALRDKQRWFRQTAFRQAVSSAIDRDAIVKLAYGGLASSLWAHVTEGNPRWLNRSVPRPGRSLARSRELLKAAGFRWNAIGRLIDDTGKEVGFSILTSAGNAQRLQVATIIQDDLKQLGLKAKVVALEFRSMLDRVLQSHDYEAAVMTLASGDTDPNAEMNVLTAKGATRVWKLRSDGDTPWERELDQLMHEQASTLDHVRRKRLYDRVQQIVAEQLPFICVATPHVLVGAAAMIENVQPSILRPYLLGAADQLYLLKGIH